MRALPKMCSNIVMQKRPAINDYDYDYDYDTF